MSYRENAENIVFFISTQENPIFDRFSIAPLTRIDSADTFFLSRK